MSRLISAFIFLIIGNLHSTASCEEPVSLSVSTSFSEVLLKKSSAPYQGETVLDFLKRNSEVETSFGGTFVTKIAGVPLSGKMNHSWFYYINGLLAEKGAASYQLKPGDKVVWDYHAWTNDSFIPAIIGSYPQPFVSGYGDIEAKTEVLFSPSAKTQAETLADSLTSSGAKEVFLKPLQDNAKSDNCEILRIVLGPWPEIRGQTLVSSRYKHAKKSGIQLSFDSNSRPSFTKTTREDKNRAGNEPTEAGVILASSYAHQACLIWIVSGSTTEALTWTTATLTKRPSAIENMVQAIVLESGEVINAP